MYRSALEQTSTHSDAAFRARVLDLARKLHPTVPFEPSPENAQLILAGEKQFGLHNLRARFEQSDGSPESLSILVAEHFQFVLGDHAVPDFATACPRLLPQLMPPAFAERVPILHLPFGRSLAIGIVLDSEKGYQYLREEDALRWRKSKQELLATALANLAEASRELPLHSAENEDARFIAIATKDGFDAARILLPEFQEYLASQLGSPIRFGIPNRDFLICWNADASAPFVEFVSAKLADDFATQPYPLSTHVFEVASNGTISEGA